MFKRKKKENTLKNKKEICKEEQTQISNNSQIESTVDNSFFYTNDKFFDQMDSTMILNTLMQSYPQINLINSDTEIKHAFLEIFQNKQYVEQLLEQYNLTINDFIKIIGKNYISIFKGIFLKKIKTLLEIYDN